VPTTCSFNSTDRRPGGEKKSEYFTISVSARKFYLRAEVAPEDHFQGVNTLGKGPIN